MNQRGLRVSGTPAIVAAFAAALVAVQGCGDDPFSFNWDDSPDTVVLYSLARPELNLDAGFNFLQGVTVRVEAPTSTGLWDVALDTRGSELVLLPPGALGVESRARVSALAGERFEDVVRAPSDTLRYVANDPVPVESGTIYVIRTGQSVGSFGTRCVYYAKLEPILIDVVTGALTFRFVTNPICNDRDLIPPD